MSDDPQDLAEALDEDRVDEDDDRTGDRFGEALPGYPPTRPMGVNTVGVTPFEENAGESFAERTVREDGERSPDAAAEEVGQLVDDSATTEDREAQQVADAEPATELAPEEAAMHIEE